jgi:putative flavoprotein involved in K+ transport
MADYLEAYAARFELPVRMGVTVDRLSKNGSGFVVTSGDRRFEAANVVVAMATHQTPRLPPFASDLDRGIVQLHAGEYRHPGQVQDGGLLVAGAGSSGAEIALDARHNHPTWLAGRDTGHVPFRIESFAARFLIPLVLRVVFHRVLTVSTPIGRRERVKLISRGHPLVRTKPKDLAAAGIDRVPKVVGVRDGLPLLEDGRVLKVANVIWCTGFGPDFSWIDLPVAENEHAIGLLERLGAARDYVGTGGALRDRSFRSRRGRPHTARAAARGGRGPAGPGAYPATETASRR